MLFVGHANTVPALLKTLGHPVESNIPETARQLIVVPKAKVPDRFTPTLLRGLGQITKKKQDSLIV